MNEAKIIAKAKRAGVAITETANGHHFFSSSKTNSVGSAWLQDGSFKLFAIIYNTEEDDSYADSVRDFFRWLNT